MAKWIQPFPDKCRTDKFGIWPKWRKDAGLGAHRGTDWGNGVKGKTIPAVTTGKIEMVKWSAVLGWVVVQSNTNGKWFIGYCHLKEKPALKVGQAIKVGEAIGKVGNTGSASAGDHLHATLGRNVNAVFAGKVYDLHAFIEKRIAAEEAKQSA